jgi:putative MATE family efflux protein
MQINSSYRDIMKIAMPVIAGSIAMTILNITDTAFLGRVGETELGASAVGGVLYFAFAMIGVSIGTGTQIMIARRAGEKKESQVGEIFDNSFIILLLLSVLLFAVLKWGSPCILQWILNSDELIKSTGEFLKYRSYGLIFIMIATVFRSFYVGIAQPKIYGTYSFLMAGINMLLCYILIFGNWGFKPMGIGGAGLASSIAEFISLLFIFSYTFMKKGIKSYQLFRFSKVSAGMAKKIMNLSLPLVVQNLLSMGSWFIFFVFIEKIGKHELATSNIVRGAYMINMTPIWGFSVAANSMVSNIIGQGKQHEVFQLLKRIIRITLLITILIITVNLLIPGPLLSLFSNDPVLIQDSMGSLRIISLAMVFFSFAIVSISALSGTGATQTALYIEIGAIVIYLVYNYLAAFVFHWSVEMLWMSEVIYWLFTGIASYYYVKSMHWKKINL